MGNNYPTSRRARCPSFHECKLCHGCQKYDPTDIVCSICESRKPIDLICSHTDYQQWIVEEISRRMKQPLAHPEDKGQPVRIPASSNEWEDTLNNISDEMGRIRPLRNK